MFSNPNLFPSTSISKTKSIEDYRVPGSLEFTDDAFRNFSSQQIINTILNDIDIHSIQSSKNVKKPKKLVPQCTSKSTTKQSTIGCNCRKSKCLKLYCQCFSIGEYCKEGCNCEDCANNIQNQQERVSAVVTILEREPNAFLLKKKQSMKEKERGCTCRRSFCQKKYCDCFAQGEACTKHCRCEGCKNCESSSSKKKSEAKSKVKKEMIS